MFSVDKQSFWSLFNIQGSILLGRFSIKKKTIAFNVFGNNNIQKEVLKVYLFGHEIVKLIRYLKKKQNCKRLYKQQRSSENIILRVFFDMSSFSGPKGNLRVVALFGVYWPIVINLFNIVSRLTVPVFRPDLVLTFTFIISPQRHHKAIPENAAPLHSYKGP